MTSRSIALPKTSITTVDLLAKINEFRTEAGKNPIENRKFLARVRDELDGDQLAPEKFSAPVNQYSSAGTKQIDGYTLTRDQALLVGMRECKTVRRRVLAWIKHVEEHAQWIDTRESLKIVWWETQDAVLEYYGSPTVFDYAREQNMVYVIIFGMTAKELRVARGLNRDQSAKDGMSERELEHVAALEAANKLFLQADMERAARKDALIALHSSNVKKLGAVA